VIVMTSNLGSSSIIGLTAHDREAMRERVTEALRQAFRPEFLNRIDEVVIFEPLSRDEIGEIVEIQLARVMDRLADRSIAVQVTPAAKGWLAQRGYDPVYGARPLKRLIQREVLDGFARKLLTGELHDGEVVTLDADGDGLTFRANLTEAPLVA
jgi:ATP-dependent Clp protease ATP-binding subunit ClpB